MYAIGVDIGGTNTKFGIVDREGKILEQGRLLTNAQETVQALSVICMSTCGL